MDGLDGLMGMGRDREVKCQGLLQVLEAKLQKRLCTRRIDLRALKVVEGIVGRTFTSFKLEGLCGRR
jgi:hypothetical protein